MVDFRQLTPDFYVAPQITAGDVETAAALGVKLIINDRPLAEADQTDPALIEAAAKAKGIAYAHIPIQGAPSPAVVEAFQHAVAAADGPVLAYCRSGTRSAFAWAMSEAAQGLRPSQEIALLALKAGYDVSGVLP